MQAIDSALGRASQVDAAFTPANKKKTSLLDESYELQRSAFMAARASLKGDFKLTLPVWCRHTCYKDCIFPRDWSLQQDDLAATSLQSRCSKDPSFIVHTMRIS